MDKYKKLREFLSRQSVGPIVLTFTEIEALIGSDLPLSARSEDARAWSNEREDATHPLARAWWRAGYRVWNVEPKQEMVTFTRHEEPVTGRTG